MRQKEFSSECVFVLTDTYSENSLNPAMAKLKHIVAGLSKQSARKWDEVASASQELSQLLETYQRYRELDARIVQDSESAKIGIALVLNLPQKLDPNGDAFDPKNRQECEELYESSPTLPITGDDLDLTKYPLWKIMREILRQVQEMRVYELETHLKNFGIKTTRSAVESALSTHRQQFEIRQHGREKFVAWKGGEHVPATTRKRK